MYGRNALDLINGEVKTALDLIIGEENYSETELLLWSNFVAKIICKFPLSVSKNDLTFLDVFKCESCSYSERYAAGDKLSEIIILSSSRQADLASCDGGIFKYISYDGVDETFESKIPYSAL